MKRFSTILVILLYASGVYSSGLILPEGWRLPNKHELSDSWREGNYKNAYVIGDFNGDGKNEGAYLAVTKDGKYEGLIAFVYLDEKEKWFVLDRMKLGNTVFMGLSLYKPGKYMVLCLSGDECNGKYRKEIVIKNDAFSYYRPGSASSIFVWNPKTKTFDRIWQSD